MLAGNPVRRRVSAKEAFAGLTYRLRPYCNSPSYSVSPPTILPHLPKRPTWGRGIHEQLCQHDVLLSRSFTGSITFLLCLCFRLYRCLLDFAQGLLM